MPFEQRYFSNRELANYATLITWKTLLLAKFSNISKFRSGESLCQCRPQKQFDPVKLFLQCFQSSYRNSLKRRKNVRRSPSVQASATLNSRWIFFISSRFLNSVIFLSNIFRAISSFLFSIPLEISFNIGRATETPNLQKKI